MQHWVARFFFSVVAALAVAGVIGGTACTRWGTPNPVTPTVAPLSNLYVDASTGSDTTGNGSMSKPYKTLTKAVAVLTAAKSVSPSGVTITLEPGNYDSANGEVFPIVVSKSVTITGSNYASGPKSGSFVNGLGEDTFFEQVVHAPPKSAYATIDVIPPAAVSLGSLYVGASKVKLPSSRAFYASLDVLGTVTAGVATFGAGIATSPRNVDGVIVPGGSFSCESCSIRGNDFGIGALSVTVPTSSPSATGPTVALTHGQGDSTISASVANILTDGSVNVTASGETFARAYYAYADALQAVVVTPVRGTVDFGGGAGGSSGGNDFIGARSTEILVTRRFETVSALDDVWNPNQQRSDRNGRYPRTITFAAGASGKNVTIHSDATGSTVTVGPAPVPTPTPTTTPSTSPSATPT